MRLVGGVHPWMGRLEILHNDEWGTVCDDLWSLENSQVVCRQLGYATAYVTYQKQAFYGQGSGIIWLDDVHCTGTEQQLEHCIFWDWGSHNCDHHEDIGVSCSMLLDLHSCILCDVLCVLVAGNDTLTTGTPSVILDCPPHKIYRSCGSFCPLTCDQPLFPMSLTCSLFCSSGCFCPVGQVEYQDICVYPQFCPGQCYCAMPMFLNLSTVRVVLVLFNRCSRTYSYHHR